MSGATSLTFLAHHEFRLAWRDWWSMLTAGKPHRARVVVFALLAVEDLDLDDSLRTAISVIALTVLLSVILHGSTADILARRYGGWIRRTSPPTETAPATEPRTRRSLVPWHHRQA